MEKCRGHERFPLSHRGSFVKVAGWQRRSSSPSAHKRRLKDTARPDSHRKRSRLGMAVVFWKETCCQYQRGEHQTLSWTPPISISIRAFPNARLSCFLKFDVNESSFSGSKVELQAASFDLLVYTVESLTKRGGESGRGVEDIGKLGAE